MSSGGGGTSTTVQKAEPPAFVKPFSLDLLNRASSLSQQPFQPPLPGGAERVAPLSSLENIAGLGIANTVLNNPALTNAQGGLAALADPNAAFSPLTNALVSRAQGDITDQFNLNVVPSTAATFQKSGVFGGSAQQELESAQRFSLARALGDVETGIRGGALDRSIAASQALPNILAAQLGGFGALGQVGQQQRGISQAISDIDFQNLLAQRQEPLSQLDILARAIATASGSATNLTQTSTGNTGNPFLAGLGAGGTFLGGLGSLIGANPFGVFG